MQISAWMIYGVTVIGSFCTLLNLVVFFCFVAAFMLGICCMNESRAQKLLPWLRRTS